LEIFFSFGISSTILRADEALLLRGAMNAFAQERTEAVTATALNFILHTRFDVESGVSDVKRRTSQLMG
jgi:hypothetical protein